MAENNFIKHLKENWTIYLFVSTIIYNVAITGSRITNAESRIDTLEAYQRSEQVTLTEIKTRLASIDTNLEYLKKK